MENAIYLFSYLAILLFCSYSSSYLQVPLVILRHYYITLNYMLNDAC